MNALIQAALTVLSFLRIVKPAVLPKAGPKVEPLKKTPPERKVVK